MPADDFPALYTLSTCSTCRKAKQWLTARGVSYREVAIVEAPPSAALLGRLVRASGLPIRKWLNTSGQSYRALVAARGKAALDALTEREWLALLAADGKLIKRPILHAGAVVCVGFDEAQYQAAFG